LHLQYLYKLNQNSKERLYRTDLKFMKLTEIPERKIFIYFVCLGDSSGR
jgi:hypothetical protein